MRRSHRKRTQFPWQTIMARALPCILLLAAISGSAHGQQATGSAATDTAKPSDIEPRGQRPAIRPITYGDWRKLCFEPAGGKTLCRTTISGTFDTGQTAIRIDVIERDGDSSARLQLFLPVGMYIPPGVKLSIDQGTPFRFPYTWCLTNFCIAADVAAPKMIKEMESGQKLVLEAVDSNVLSLSTSLPLEHFASVRQAAPLQTFDQDIDE
jgi:invasion protein IalB